MIGLYVKWNYEEDASKMYNLTISKLNPDPEGKSEVRCWPSAQWGVFFVWVFLFFPVD